MGLQETAEELKKQIEALEAEETTEETAEEAEDEVVEDEPSPEETEKVEEEPKVEEKPADPPLDDAGFARLRREKAEAKKEAEEARRRLAEMEEKLNRLTSGEPVEAVADAQTVELPSDIEEMRQERIMTKAEREFQAMEAQFRQVAPDYDGVADAYAKGIFQALRVQNPRASALELADMTKKTILTKASEFLNQGYDPIEELYEEAKSLGFTAAVAELEQEVEEKPKKASLDTLAKNRSRSANMAGASGHGSGAAPMTRAALAELSAAEYAKIPIEERRRIMQGR